ncbi:MAG TPA: hypothetical protein VK420_06715, partial [Longimicrobium sp.]|nr:hypothetical protein [Longimicrobium sp.]
RAAQQAMRAAAEANRKYANAESSLRAKTTLLQQKGSQLSPSERQELQSQIAAETTLVGQLKEHAENANAHAGEARQDARGADDKRVEVEQTANRVLKALGKGEPFNAQKSTEDVFISELVTIKLAKILGNPKLPNPRQAATQDARRMESALKAGLAHGAYVLEQQVEGNTDPLYRQGLLEDIGEHVGFLGQELAGGGDDVGALFQDEAARMALASLARTAELLGQEGAKRMAEAFAKGALGGKEKLTDPSLMGLRLRDALASGQSGAAFALELALTFGDLGDHAAADAALDALCQAMRELRERYDATLRQAEQLDGQLTQKLNARELWADQQTLVGAILGFEDANINAYVAYEQAAAALASMLAGAARVLEYAKEGRLPQGNLAVELMHQSTLTLGRTDRLATSASGQPLVMGALESQGKGQRTFLDALPEVSRALEQHAQQGGKDTFQRSAQDFLLSSGQALVQLLAPQLLALKTAARLDELSKMLKTTVGQNPQLFGLTPVSGTMVVASFSGLVHAKRPNTLREAMGSFTRAGNLALKSLALVIAGCCGATSSSGHGAELMAALKESALKLKLGRGGLGLVTTMLKRPLPTPQAAGMVTVVGTGILFNVGNVTNRVAESYSALATGISEVAAFTADADFLTAVGAMLSSISGSRLAESIAVAAVKARAQAPAKPAPKTADDVASLRDYLKKAA